MSCSVSKYLQNCSFKYCARIVYTNYLSFQLPKFSKFELLPRGWNHRLHHQLITPYTCLLGVTYMIPSVTYMIPSVTYLIPSVTYLIPSVTYLIPSVTY
jgi:hypothetical protein